MNIEILLQKKAIKTLQNRPFAILERRQNGGERRKIVQDYLASIDNSTERLVCYLYLNNFDDYEVCKELKMKMKRLKAIKAEIRLKLLQAGIRAVGKTNA